MRISLFMCGLVLVVAGSLQAADWTQFRGSSSNGAATEEKLPTAFNDTENLIWKVKLPGSGSSSPIVLGDKVFVTCYSGYGVAGGGGGDKSGLERHLLCLNLKDGTEVWKKPLKTDTKEAEYRGQMTQHGYASNSPATDGKQIYVFLGTGGVYAFDLEGNQKWQKGVGTSTDGWGSASSVVLTDDLVIVNASIESKAIVALKKTDGEQAWKFTLSGRSWSTPAMVKSPDGKMELVVNGEGRISGLDPATGKENWFCDGIQDYTCPSVTAGDGVAYVAGGRRSQIIAVKTGGSGDVTDTHKLWSKVMGGNVTTPALVGDKIYGVSDSSIAYCLDAKTGATSFQTRLTSSTPAAGETPPPPADQPPDRPMRGGRGGPGGGGPGGGGRGGRGGGGGGGGLYASVVASDGKLFAVTRTSGVYVLAAEPSYKVLAHNKFDHDKTRFDATPSIAAGKLFLRSEQSLYCIGTK